MEFLEKELETAFEYYNISGKDILEDKEISLLVKEYKVSIERTWKQMALLNITKYCGECRNKLAFGK